MPLDDVEQMLTQVGAALTVAHRAGVVHRDVKPANIFFDGDGNFFLGDFGIAYVNAAPHVGDRLAVGRLAGLCVTRAAPPRARSARPPTSTGWRSPSSRH